MLRIHSSSPINHSSKASLGQTGWSYPEWGELFSEGSYKFNNENIETR